MRGVSGLRRGGLDVCWSTGSRFCRYRVSVARDEVENVSLPERGRPRMKYVGSVDSFYANVHVCIIPIFAGSSIGKTAAPRKGDGLCREIV